MKLLLLILFWGSCAVGLSHCHSPADNVSQSTEQSENALTTPRPSRLAYRDTLYVPVYSDIYNRSDERRLLLTSIVSIRNTSLRDSIFIERADYYSTDGKKVRSHFENGLWLAPMQTTEIRIKKTENEGGSGANFVVYLGSNSAKAKPIVQAVMLLADGPKSFSFTAEGISISQ